MADEQTPDTLDRSELLALTSEIVSSHVSNNPVSQADLSAMIESVFGTLESLGAPAEEPVEELKPAVSIKKSVQDEFIVCLEDGKQLKMLKRHLMTAYGMTPDDYRQRWSLPSDYPMVAPAYARKRQELAKKIGLGRKPAAKAAAKPAPKKRAPARKKKAAT
ncbi:MAG: MucR family transcriptional regulator [Pseudomonadota bacterium]